MKIELEKSFKLHLGTLIQLKIKTGSYLVLHLDEANLGRDPGKL